MPGLWSGRRGRREKLQLRRVTCSVSQASLASSLQAIAERRDRVRDHQRSKKPIPTSNRRVLLFDTRIFDRIKMGLSFSKLCTYCDALTLSWWGPQAATSTSRRARRVRSGSRSDSTRPHHGDASETRYADSGRIFCLSLSSCANLHGSARCRRRPVAVGRTRSLRPPRDATSPYTLAHASGRLALHSGLNDTLVDG